ncbi:calcium homeostasis modulator protein 5-like [Clavelina lepadiformis]|uniref:calcium homeostasis modulator protein 5-like n=1 Tax=Clavelina lepadiformis TaxID=159417 RepID=UPI004041FC58
MSVSTIFGQLLSKISISISSQKRAIVNVIIMGLTAAAERIISVTAFRCPCITQTELDSGETNYWYGVAYFAAPAVVLFLLAVLVGVNIWIGFNGCCRRAFPKRQCEEHCVSCEYHDCSNFCKQLCCCSCNDKSKSAWCFFFKNIAHALIAPSAWLSLALLDGNSLACAIIPLPYFLIGNETCDEVTTLKNSDDYNDKRGQLQAIGWGLIAGLFLLTAVTYTCSHCCSSKTYFQHKFQSMYRRKEQQALEEEIHGNENTDEKIKNAARVIVESQPTPV